jgi:hypothetical protein
MESFQIKSDTTIYSLRLIVDFYCSSYVHSTMLDGKSGLLKPCSAHITAEFKHCLSQTTYTAHVEVDNFNGPKN